MGRDGVVGLVLTRAARGALSGPPAALAVLAALAAIGSAACQTGDHMSTHPELPMTVDR
jgi:hypothetical protein